MGKKKVNPEIAADAPANQFELDGKKYNVLHGIIAHKASGQAKLSAADICIDEEVQRMLVEGGSSAIQEVTE